MRVEKKKSAVVGNRFPVSFHASHESDSVPTAYGESTSTTLTTTKINNFSEILLAVYKTCYDDCMKTIWNAVIDDPVADCCTNWLKRKALSGCDAASIAAADKCTIGICEVNIDNDAKPDVVCSFRFFSIRLYVVKNFSSPYYVIFICCCFSGSH